MGKFHILFLFFVALMFAVSLVSLFVYHCYLVVHNRTTLEAFRPAVFRTGPDKNGFSLGAYNNFQEVFGDNPKTWFIPVQSSLGDGVSYPVHSRHQPSSYHSMDSTQTRYIPPNCDLHYKQSCAKPMSTKNAKRVFGLLWL